MQPVVAGDGIGAGTDQRGVSLVLMDTNVAAACEADTLNSVSVCGIGG